jgi:hypothetical protein
MGRPSRRANTSRGYALNFQSDATLCGPIDENSGGGGHGERPPGILLNMIGGALAPVPTGTNVT